jgi:hypothetical protein
MAGPEGLRVLRTVPVLITIFCLNFPAYAKYSGGTGEPNDPYQIATAEDLMLLSNTPGDYNKRFILTADINLDPNLPGCKVFDKAVIAPNSEMPFTGVFDGNGCTISHLKIEGAGYLGLFGELGYKAVINDLGVVDVNITGSGGYIGGLAGYNVSGYVADCYSTGVVSGRSSVGGLIGYNDRAEVARCYSTSVVRGTEWYVGGLMGYSWNGTVTYCYSTGPVSGYSSVGGLVGQNDYSGTDVHAVTQCYNSGSVNGVERVGGLVGWNDRGYLSQCYSIGPVSGTSSVGGLVGRDYQGNITACFWDVETSGQTASAGGMGKTTDEMHTAGTFLDAGWYFVGETENGTEDIWRIDEGRDYPRLWWERTVWFADYMPLDPNEYGIKTFEWVYGRTGEYTSRIGGTETVTYLSGSIIGVQIIEDNNTLVVINDGLNVSFLASGEWILSTDPNLTAHPPAWTFTGLYDDMIIDQGVWYLVKKDMSEWEAVDSQQLLIDIQDITVPQGRYNNAVIFWYLDTAYPFTPLDFHGKESDLGITLPSSSQGAGYSVTGFDIFAVNTGLIVQGDIDAATGSLNDLAVLKQVE